MSLTGHVIGGPADYDYDGATLTADLAIGDTVLHVDDVADFDEDASKRDAQLVIDPDFDTDGELVDGSATPMAYDTCDDDAGTITLAAASTVAASEGDRVYLVDPVSGYPVGRIEVLVAIDDSDTTGDPLPAYVDTALLDSVGDVDLDDLAVELEEDDDDQLYVSAFPGLTKRQGGVKFKQDQVTVSDLGDQTLQLSYVPKKNSEHLYWNGLYQPGSEWSRDRWTVTVPDPDGLIQVGHRLTMEYAYTDPATQSFATYDDAFADLNVLGRWDLDDTSGTVAAATLGSDGTLINGPDLALSGLVADGGTAIGTDYPSAEDITIPIAGLATGTAPGWIAFWFKYRGASNPFSTVAFRDNTDAVSLGYMLNLFGSNPAVRVGGETHPLTSLSSATYLDGDEHLFILNQIHTEVRVFLDGVMVDNYTMGGAGSEFWLDISSPLHFGRYGTLTQYASYVYDRIAVGAAEVSEAQAAAIWDIGRGGS